MPPRTTLPLTRHPLTRAEEVGVSDHDTRLELDDDLAFADHFGFRFPRFDRVTESMPLVLVEDGKLLHDRLRRENISPAEILSSARQSQGIARMDQIRYAVLERSGGISVVPYDAAS